MCVCVYVDAYSCILLFTVIVRNNVDQWRENRPHCLEVIDNTAVLNHLVIATTTIQETACLHKNRKFKIQEYGFQK
jgi:hypothetical protein